MAHPIIVQGGMGAGVSNWRLARTVSQRGQLGAVSGTALDVILARRLQEGDPDGDMRRALARFPIPGMAQRALDRYFVPGGKPAEQPFKPTPVVSQQPAPALVELIVLTNFAEVFLAREGHTGLVGINYLQKIQFPTLPSLFGAMLAGVDYVLMGAAFPWPFPASWINSRGAGRRGCISKSKAPRRASSFVARSIPQPSAERLRLN